MAPRISAPPKKGAIVVPKELKAHWQQFLARYIATRQSLIGLILVVDARHGLTDHDHSLLASLLASARPVLLLATKMDKLTRAAQGQAASQLVEVLARCFPLQAANVEVVPFSATRQIGLEPAESTIARWLGFGQSDASEGSGTTAQKKGPLGQGE